MLQAHSSVGRLNSMQVVEGRKGCSLVAMKLEARSVVGIP